MLAIIKLKHSIFWVIYFQVFFPCALNLDTLYFFSFTVNYYSALNTKSQITGNLACLHCR